MPMHCRFGCIGGHATTRFKVWRVQYVFTCSPYMTITGVPAVQAEHGREPKGCDRLRYSEHPHCYDLQGWTENGDRHWGSSQVHTRADPREVHVNMKLQGQSEPDAFRQMPEVEISTSGLVRMQQLLGTAASKFVTCKASLQS